MTKTYEQRLRNVDYKAGVRGIYPDAECYDFWGKNYYAVFATVKDSKIKLGDGDMMKHAWKSAYQTVIKQKENQK